MHTEVHGSDHTMTTFTSSKTVEKQASACRVGQQKSAARHQAARGQRSQPQQQQVPNGEDSSPTVANNCELSRETKEPAPNSEPSHLSTSSGISTEPTDSALSIRSTFSSIEVDSSASSSPPPQLDAESTLDCYESAEITIDRDDETGACEADRASQTSNSSLSQSEELKEPISCPNWSPTRPEKPIVSQHLHQQHFDYLYSSYQRPPGGSHYVTAADQNFAPQVIFASYQPPLMPHHVPNFYHHHHQPNIYHQYQQYYPQPVDYSHAPVVYYHNLLSQPPMTLAPTPGYPLGSSQAAHLYYHPPANFGPPPRAPSSVYAHQLAYAPPQPTPYAHISYSQPPVVLPRPNPHADHLALAGYPNPHPQQPAWPGKNAPRHQRDSREASESAATCGLVHARKPQEQRLPSAEIRASDSSGSPSAKCIDNIDSDTTDSADGPVSASDRSQTTSASATIKSYQDSEESERPERQQPQRRRREFHSESDDITKPDISRPATAPAAGDTTSSSIAAGSEADSLVAETNRLPTSETMLSPSCSQSQASQIQRPLESLRYKTVDKNHNPQVIFASYQPPLMPQNVPSFYMHHQNHSHHQQYQPPPPPPPPMDYSQSLFYCHNLMPQTPAEMAPHLVPVAPSYPQMMVYNYDPQPLMVPPPQRIQPPVLLGADARHQANLIALSRFKLGYSLVPTLPVEAQPAKIRQAYGMDKVWLDEFELLFSDFPPHISWTLIEVETNPSIRVPPNNIVGYKGRYLIQAYGNAEPKSGRVAEVSAVGGQEEPADEQGTSSAEEEAGTEESDCDSGAMIESISGSSDVSPANEIADVAGDASTQVESPPREPLRLADSAPKTTTPSRSRIPNRFRMFIDSAKVRFCCDNCGHGWTSMKGRVVFWYELFELLDVACNPMEVDLAGGGGGQLVGYCAYKLFGQQCDVCKIENRFERPMWYPEEVTKALGNLCNKIGQVYFGFKMPAIDKQRRAGKPKTSHNSSLCQACHDGVCTDRK